MKRIKTYLLIAVFALFILGNPNEQRYLNRLQEDYGRMHGGEMLSIQELNHIGNSSFNSYFLWSFYDYSFGSIQVNYFGIAFMTFYLGSNTQAASDEAFEKAIS